jgi:hypothetical protein
MPYQTVGVLKSLDNPLATTGVLYVATEAYPRPTPILI